MGLVENNYKKTVCILFIFYSLYVLASFLPIRGAYPFVETACIDKPVLQDDYSLHFTSTLDSSSFLRQNQRVWGYDPYFLAGYPSGTVFALTTQWTILFNVLIGRFFSPPFVFNFAIFIGLLIMPILALFTARHYGLGKANSLAFFAFSLFLLAGFQMIKNFTYCGMYGFLLAVFLSFLTSSFFFHYCTEKRTLDLINMAVFGTLALWVHPFSTIVCLILCGPVVLFNFRKLSFGDICKCILFIAPIILINLIWIWPFLRFLHLTALPASSYMKTSYALMFSELKRNSPVALIMILFVYFLYSRFSNRDHILAVPFSLSFIILFIISFFGSQVGFVYEPARFLVPLVLLCVLAIASLVKEEWGTGNVLFGVTILLLLVSLLSRPVEFTCGYKNPEETNILNFIKTNTSKNARIHVQESSTHAPFDRLYTVMIPRNTSRQILSAPFTYPPMKFKFTQFIDDVAFDKRLNDLSDNELEKYLELYNIKYFLVFGNNESAFFDKKRRFRRVFSSGIFRIYDYLDSDESFCYKCNATVTADYDKIIVENATPGSVILKYHYIDTLRIEPGNLKIGPIRILDDPVPFILVENGERSAFVITNN